MSFSKLTRDGIVGEALALLEKDGLQGVTLRKVAARLDVSVSSLYWHVRDRDALYRLLSERIFRSCLEAVPASTSWPQWLRGFGLALWQAQCAIPDTQTLIVQRRTDGEVRHAVRAEILAALETLGLPRAIGDVAQRSVQALVTGWTALSPAGGDHADQADRLIERALDLLIAGVEAAMADDSARPT